MPRRKSTRGVSVAFNFEWIQLHPGPINAKFSLNFPITGPEDSESTPRPKTPKECRQVQDRRKKNALLQSSAQISSSIVVINKIINKIITIIRLININIFIIRMITTIFGVWRATAFAILLPYWQYRCHPRSFANSMRGPPSPRYTVISTAIWWKLWTILITLVNTMEYNAAALQTPKLFQYLTMNADSFHEWRMDFSIIKKGLQLISACLPASSLCTNREVHVTWQRTESSWWPNSCFRNGSWLTPHNHFPAKLFLTLLLNPAELISSVI